MGFPLEAAIAQGQLAQLLMELGANCAEAIGPTGRIEIAAGEVPGGPGSCHCDPPISLEGPHLALLVRDDGPGVPPPLRDAIFDPFFTTKPGTATTGLGLTACRSIASRARGHVCCDLGDGPGATFRVLLPLAGDDDPLAITGSQERPVGVRLLLVDDEPMIRTLIARHLQRTGFDVEQAADGEEALAHLAAGAPFDLLVTDVVMPGLDGFELALEARRRQPDLPILFISGCSVTSVQAEPDPTLHPIELLAKPFGMDELARRVRGVLSARLEGAEAPRTPLPAQR
jgi:two-component system cell cycle sensor histidine kinase/response regulator CckA